MDREQIIEKLREHEEELRRLGVSSLSLFGSLARREPYPQDVDLAVRFSPSIPHRGWDYFGLVDDLEARLRKLLGHEVDIVKEPVRKKQMQDEIDRDRAIVF